MDMGLKIDKVYFDVKPRSGGESKYTLKKMCSFALNGITSFSVAPLRLVSTMGITLSKRCPRYVIEEVQTKQT